MPTQYTTKDIARFYSHIKVMPNGCHEWQGMLGHNGYGRIKIKRKKFVAHRVAWQIVNGPIPDGLFCLHHCDNRRCCRIEHLFLGTNKDNMQDSMSKDRNVKGEAHGMAKLTDDTVREIRALTANGMAKRAIARQFHISAYAVYSIDRRLNWKHIP